MGLEPRGARIRGRIRFDGKDLLSLRRSERRRLLGHDMAMIYQDALSSLNPAMTIKSQLKQVVRRGGRRTPTDLLELVGLDPERTLSSYPHELSGGQRQRVMIARALMMRPKLLVADEATSMLDASLRVNVLNVLTDLRDQLGMTVLFITHDIGQACYVADRVLVMEHGVMVEQGRAEDVIFNPQHEYTQRLLSDVPKLHEQAGSPTGVERV
jgi:peptide/nickel transport system permease protein